MKKWILFLVICLLGIGMPHSTGCADADEESMFIPAAGTAEYGIPHTRDVTYPNEAGGFTASGFYEARKEEIREQGTEFLEQHDGILEVKSQVWKEAAPSPFYAYYRNTTEFYWNLPNGDYDISVVLVNPTGKEYDAVLQSGTQIQSETKKIVPGAETELKGRFSVTAGKLFLDILAASDAESLNDAEMQSVYVKEIRLTKAVKETGKKVPTLFIAGDSTAASYGPEHAPWEGWGQEFYRYFKGGKTVRQKNHKELGFNTKYRDGYRKYEMKEIVIENWAVPGESTATYISSGKWDGILNKAVPGDYVFVQFGHNDSEKSKGIKYAGVDAYKKNLELFAESCRQRGVQCVFLSPIPKYEFYANGKCKTSVNSYRMAMKSVADKKQVPFLDIGAYGASFFTNIGKKQVKPYYLFVEKGKYPAFPKGKKDPIHLQKKGAVKMAQIVATRIKKDGRLKKLASCLNVETDYYKGIEKAGKILSIKKKGKKVWNLRWKPEQHAAYYKIYMHRPGKKGYRFIRKCRGTKTLLRGYSTRRKYKFKIRVIY